MPKFVSAYSTKNKPKSLEYPPTLTKQSMKDECNINKIVDKYQRIGVVEHVNENQHFFADVTDVDFQASLNLVQSAQEAFDGLPSELRKRFANDPALLLEFLGDPSNHDEAVKLGLIRASDDDVEEEVKKVDKKKDEPAEPVES